MTDRPGADGPDAIQHRIQQVRARLLAGRGPGASSAEVARWQRDRPLLGAQPAPAERQEVADQAILARGDPAALQDLIVRRRAGLSASLTVLTGQLRDRRGRAGAALRLAGLAGLAGAAAGATWTLAARTVRHRRGARSWPGATRESRQ